MPSIVDELVTLLGLEIDPAAEGTAAKMASLTGSVAKAAVVAGAALIGTAAAVKAYAVATAGAIDESAKLAESVGVTYERLQELEYAAGKAAGPSGVGALHSDLQSLQKSMASTVPGEYNKTLMQLGISTRDVSGKLKTADEVLLDFGDKIKGMSTQRQAQFASQLGISKESLALVKDGSGNVRTLTKEARALGLVLDENAKVKAAKFQQALFTTRAVVDGLGKSIAVGLLPAMSDGLELFTKWVVSNRELIKLGIEQLLGGVSRGFDMVGSVLRTVYGYVEPLVGGFGDLFKGLDATQPIALAVAAAIFLIAAAVVAATWPILAAVAGLTALVLVVEDVYAAFNGQDSIIGGWVAEFAEAYPQLAKYLGGLLDLAISIGKVFGGSVIAALKAFGQVFMAIFGGVATLLDKVIGGVESFIKFTGLASLPGNMTAAVNAAAGGSANVPAGVMAGAGGGTVNNTVNQTINGAGDPRAVGQEAANRSGIGAAVQQKQPGAFGPTVG